jgi:putative oxidoreductase
MVNNVTAVTATPASDRRADADATWFPATAVNTTLLLVRVIVGVIFMLHGAQKVFGAFGGPGLSAMMGQMGPVLGFLVPVGEFFGGLGMVVGFLSRFSAAANIVIMLGAIAMVHGKNGFFMSDKGFEYNLALIGLLLPVLLLGPGQWSAGRFLPFLPGVAKTGRPVPAIE